MNIFVLSKAAKKAARYHCDKHVVKMILESIQLLFAAWCVGPVFTRWNLVALTAVARRYAYGTPGWESRVTEAVSVHPVTKQHGEGARTAPYRLTHANHPCSLWVKRSASNYAWLVDMTTELCAEKRRRWPKSLPHKCEAYLDALREPPSLMPDVGLTPFAIAIKSEDIRAKYPNCSSDRAECVLAYREYYKRDKPFAAWKGDNPPEWFTAIPV
jgi:hypothetical protein